MKLKHNKMSQLRCFKDSAICFCYKDLATTLLKAKLRSSYLALRDWRIINEFEIKPRSGNFLYGLYKIAIQDIFLILPIKNQIRQCNTKRMII